MYFFNLKNSKRQNESLKMEQYLQQKLKLLLKLGNRRNMRKIHVTWQFLVECLNTK